MTQDQDDALQGNREHEIGEYRHEFVRILNLSLRFCKLEDHAGSDRNIIREIFAKEEERIQQLFSLCLESSNSVYKRNIIHHADNTDPSVTFRQWIQSGYKDCRAKILAIALQLDSEDFWTVWETILYHFHESLDHKKPEGIQLTDEALPYSLEEATELFGSKDLATTFCNDQHKYCPPDFRLLNLNSHESFTALKHAINQASMRCEVVEDSESDEEPALWFPFLRIRDVLEKNKHLVDECYISWCHSKHEDASSKSPKLRRRYLEKVIKDSQAVRRGLEDRQNVFALLLHASFEHSSPIWDKFFTECITNAATQQDTRPMEQPFSPTGDQIGFLHDSMLPFERTKHKKEFTLEEWDQIALLQSRFCAVRFSGDGDDDIKINGTAQICLPLIKREYINKGFFGRVFKVKLAAGYYDPVKQIDLAMKVLDGNGTDRYTEWRLHEKTSLDKAVGRHVLTPLAIVRNDAKVYIFMPLADCNMEELMEGKYGDDELWNQPMDGSTLSKYDICVRKLGFMLGIALELRYLHHDLHDRNMRHSVIIHGDIKAKNVLYTKSREHYCLQLADYGIAMFQYGRAESRLGRHEQTRIALDLNCPNYPPEAQQEQMVDRTCDIWQIGIIISEWVAYISGGLDALRSFREARSTGPEFNNTYKDHSYYRAGSDEPNARNAALLKPGIVKWYQQLIDKTRHTPVGELYAKCWFLLSKGLLNCEPSNRLDAQQLCTVLSAICNNEVIEDMACFVATDLNPLQHTDTDSRTIVRTNTDLSTTGTRPSISSQQRDILESGTNEYKSRSDSAISKDLSQNKSSTTQVLYETAQIQAAIEQGSDAAVDMISPSTTVEAVDSNGDTLLHVAVHSASPKVTEKLLGLGGGILARSQNNSGMNALHVVARIANQHGVDHAALLLDKDLTLLRTKDRVNRTPLEIATDYGPDIYNYRKSLIALLIERHQQLAQKSGKPVRMHFGQCQADYKRLLEPMRKGHAYVARNGQ